MARAYTRERNPLRSGAAQLGQPCGAWEALAIHQVIDWCGEAGGEWYFWGTHFGADLDLLWIRGSRRWGFEIKRSSTPRLTRSLLTAIYDLGLDRAYVAHLGEQTFPLHERVTALAASRILSDLPTS
jgi:hypothetical protein